MGCPHENGSDQSCHPYNHSHWDQMPSSHSHINPSKCIKIPYANYALIGINDSGKLIIHTSKNIERFEKIRGPIFTPEFRQWFSESFSEDIFRSSNSDVCYGREQINTHQVHSFHYKNAPSGHDDNSEEMMTIEIGDKEKIEAFYKASFEAFQQSNCRQVAKAYISFIEPKKRRKYPYNGGHGADGKKGDPEKTKPDWWPPGVIHREPDHLDKPQRLQLLIHILRNLAKSHGITADKLEEAGQEAKRKIEPQQRLEILDEIYRIRRVEESYEQGEIGANTTVSVTKREISSKTQKGHESDSNPHASSEKIGQIPRFPINQGEDGKISLVHPSKAPVLRSDRYNSPFCLPSVVEYKYDPDQPSIDYFPPERNDQLWPSYQGQLHGTVAASQLIPPHALTTHYTQNPSLDIIQHQNGLPLPLELPHSPPRSTFHNVKDPSEEVSLETCLGPNSLDLSSTSICSRSTLQSLGSPGTTQQNNGGVSLTEVSYLDVDPDYSLLRPSEPSDTISKSRLMLNYGTHAVSDNEAYCDGMVLNLPVIQAEPIYQPSSSLILSETAIPPKLLYLGSGKQGNDRGINASSLILAPKNEMYSQTLNPQFPDTQGDQLKALLCEDIGSRICDKKKFKCSKCSKQYPSKVTVGRHEKRAHSKKIYGCGQCSRKFAYQSDARTHEGYAHGERIYKCSQCSKSFYLRSHAGRHEKRAHGKKI
ncbi:hypothetical protein FQN57_002457 [Myotisia sp. PD_48]|nr:hypothetical protein FQN57_002457 [Myotisia sp. PD_48]